MQLTQLVHVQLPQPPPDELSKLLIIQQENNKKFSLGSVIVLYYHVLYVCLTFQQKHLLTLKFKHLMVKANLETANAIRTKRRRWE